MTWFDILLLILTSIAVGYCIFRAFGYRLTKPYVPGMTIIERMMPRKFPLPLSEAGYYPAVHDEKGFLLCPICGENDWIEGPGGGSFGNIKCPHCEKWFNNLGPFGLQPVVR
jgi:hypothetical protein